jgi:hypothetical protein
MKASELIAGGNNVPTHIKLPDLQDILKMRPKIKVPTNDDNHEEDGSNNDEEEDSTYETEEDANKLNAFTFIAEHLMGAVVGKRAWDSHKCRHKFSDKCTASDEAYLYLVLVNSYELWINASGTKVDKGTLTKGGNNKKYCGWTQEGILMYNKLMNDIKVNRQSPMAATVETKVLGILKERYEVKHKINQTMQRRRRKKRRLGGSFPGEVDDDDESDNDNNYRGLENVEVIHELEDFPVGKFIAL